MENVENTKEKKVLSDEFIISNLIDNIKKTDSTLTKLSLLLVVIIMGYLLVQFGISNDITIGIITIKGNSVVKMIVPILYGFIFLRTYNTSMFLSELRTELKDKLEKEYKVPSSKVHLFSVFNFTDYLSKFNNRSSLRTMYSIVLIPASFVVIFIPLSFQIYIINNLFKMEFTPSIVLIASKATSLTLMALFYGNLVSKIADAVLDNYKKEGVKLKYPKFTMSISQTILSVILFGVFYAYIKVFNSSYESLNAFEGGALLLLFLMIVVISFNAIINILISYREKLSLGFKWVNIFTFLYNVFILVIFIIALF